MDLNHALADAGLKVMNMVHRTALCLSGGRVGTNVMGMRSVELHTTGRKSGQRRSTMLTAPIYDDDRVVLIASKGGDERDPDWYRNLVIEPDVELTIAGATRPMRARTASADEKSELWSQIVQKYEGYGAYQKRTSRDIPVVICEPRPTPTTG